MGAGDGGRSAIKTKQDIGEEFLLNWRDGYVEIFGDLENCSFDCEVFAEVL